MTTEEAYQILGLDRQADARAVKLAYRRRALEWHPDRYRSPEDKEYYARRFRDARDAYEHLRVHGYPELLSEPVPEPDFGPRLAGRSFASRGAEPVSQLEKLGIRVPWNLDSVVLWGVVMPTAAVTVVLAIRWLLGTVSR